MISRSLQGKNRQKLGIREVTNLPWAIMIATSDVPGFKKTGK
jgi:hypothetical protein